MYFERGGDIKDAIRIGRRANAIQVSGYYLLGKVGFDDGWISKNMGYSTTDRDGTRKILEYLERGFKPKERLFKELFFKHLELVKRTKELEHPLTLDRGFNKQDRILILDYYIQIIGEYSPIVGNIYGKRPNELQGEDLVHNGILYTIPNHAF